MLCIVHGSCMLYAAAERSVEMHRVKEILVIVVVLFTLGALVGCAEGNRTAWAYGDNESSGVRLGTMVTENNEVGILSQYFPNNDNDSQIWGVYAVHHVPGEFEIPSPFTGEPIIAGCMYAGLQTSFDNHYDEQLSAFTGFEFWGVFFIEAQFDAYDNKASVRDDTVRGVLGVRIQY